MAGPVAEQGLAGSVFALYGPCIDTLAGTGREIGGLPLILSNLHSAHANRGCRGCAFILEFDGRVVAWGHKPC